ncbi:hypothetical protein [Haloferax gibbonsii]|uniref:hypothetical protein n=1 Tax=Haloferax gibbonsii TaxID=35746 RepID=UPI0012E1BBAB|nr:hypothetical protein [Haloferax gibbonsii]
MSVSTVEQSLELDINMLRRRSFEQDGQRGTLSWARGRDGKRVVQGQYEYSSSDGDETVTVLYTIPSTNSHNGGREVSLTISIERTTCHFGGDRPWFICPECLDRQAKLYNPNPIQTDQFLCRDCHGLLYESQVHKSPLREAFYRLENSNEDLQDDGVSEDALREFYDAKKEVIETHNQQVDDFEGEFKEREIHTQISQLPPFDEWVDDLFTPSELGRSYGEYGQCEAEAQTTEERCRQPATGEHGKCHYHGGADGSDVSTN